MITPEELDRARQIVQEVLTSVDNDRDQAMEIIFDMSKKNPELRLLFAKVGLELYESVTSVKH